MNTICMSRVALLWLSTALLSMPVWADIPSASGDCESSVVETTPSSAFTLLEDGAVVRHDDTGLEWQRCPVGMNWTEDGCDGSAQELTWEEALQHADGESGWRLPNIKELRSIVERCTYEPAINQQVFPDTPSSAFWSASPRTGPGNYAWSLRFDEGFASTGGRSSSEFKVRLVRGGQ